MSGSDLFTGTLDLLILGIIEQQPLHGYAVGKHIREVSRGGCVVSGSLPAQAKETGHVGVAPDRDRTTREVLQHHARRRPAAGRRKGPLAGVL
jgi:hypothetical protein